MKFDQLILQPDGTAVGLAGEARHLIVSTSAFISKVEEVLGGREAVEPQEVELALCEECEFDSRPSKDGKTNVAYLRVQSDAVGFLAAAKAARLATPKRTPDAVSI